MTKAFAVCVKYGVLLCSLSWPPCQAQSLPALIEGVLSSHPSLRSQQALTESARDAVEGAKWQYFPTPSVGFEQVNTGNSDPNYPSYGDKNVTTLRLQQPLWTAGRLGAGVERANAGVAASQASQEATRQDLALRVVQLYADWFGALLKRQAYEKSLQAHRALQSQIERRIAGGVSPASDLTLLQGRAQQTEADLSAAQAQEQTALGRLSQLLGSALQAQALEQALSAPQTLASSAQELLEQAQAHNPNVTRLQAQARSAQAEIASARADLLPEVYLRAESQYGSYAAPNIGNQSRWFVGLSSRFGAGLSSLTQVSAAQARYEAALADIDSTRLSLGEQIQADYAQAQSGQGRLLALQASLQSAERITQAWGRQFVAGRKTWPDVMNAVRELAQLQAQIADARSAQLLLSWRLAIVGGGLDSTLESARGAGQAPLATAPVSRDSAADVWPSPAQAEIPFIPLYASEGDSLELQLATQIDPQHLGLALGLGLGLLAPAVEPGSGISTPETQPNHEGLW